MHGLWIADPTEWRRVFSQREGQPLTFKPDLDGTAAGVPLKTNALGLRSRHDPDSIQQSCPRILMMGGSITAGFGVGDEDAFPQRLEAHLNALGIGCFQVINAGQIAYSFTDIEKLARILVPIYRPQFVFFEVNQFAWNDSYHAVEGGELGQNEVDHSFATNYADEWNVPMGPIYLEAAAPEAARTNSGILGRSHAFGYFSAHARGLWKILKSTTACSAPLCLDPLPRYAAADGSNERLPAYSPLHLSPFFSGRLYEAVARAALWTHGQGIPTVVFTVNAFLDPARLRLPEVLTPITIARIAGMTNAVLFEKYGLVWDPHLNPRGNAIVAEGLVNVLRLRGFIPGESALAPEDPQWLARNRARLELDAGMIQSWIDLTNRRNLHQVVQGLRPQPFPGARKIAVILRKNGQRGVRIRGESFFEEPKKLVLAIGAGQLITADITMKKGPFQIEVPIEALPDGILDLQLTCLAQDYQYNRFDRIELF